MNPGSSRDYMLDCGKVVLDDFCKRNSIYAPVVVEHDASAGNWPFNVCAYYRPERGINIAVSKCASIGTYGRAWSYPGYTVDRTPYGVLAHELGHAFDHQRSERKGNWYGDLSMRVRGQSGEEPITNYDADKDHEWFAEMFRLFVTNPDLLKHLRPRTYRELLALKLEPVFDDTWSQRLVGAPDRTITAARRKVEVVVKVAAKAEAAAKYMAML